jgi:hypothetical protein
LLDPDSIPPIAPPHFLLGSEEEAASVAEGLDAAFAATPGARSWLAAMAGRLTAHRRRPRREKRRRSR